MYPRIILVDFYEEMTNLISIDSIAYILAKFPITQLIPVLLSSSIDLSFNDMLGREIDIRFSSDSGMDFGEIHSVCETILSILDRAIAIKLPNHIDISEYVFDKWIDNTTLALRHIDIYV